MELGHVSMQPQDIVRALWEAEYITDPEDVDAWLEHEFGIEEPFAHVLERTAEVSR